jgi:type I restriction enzyme S subunit
MTILGVVEGLPDDIESVETEDIIKIIDGDRGKNYPSSSDYVEDGYCLFLSADNVTENGLKFDSVKYITEDRHKRLNKGIVKDEDIILTTRGTVGNIGLYNNQFKNNPVRINSGMVILRPDDKKVSNKYLYQQFRSDIIQNQIKRITYGTAQPQTSVTNIKRLSILNPPLAEQRRIASVLYSVDEQLRTLTDRHDSLTTMKHGLMQDLLTGETRVTPEIPVENEVAQEESTVDEQNDWSQIKIKKCCKIQNGGTPDTDDSNYWGGEIPWFTPTEMTGNTHPISLGETDYITQRGLDESAAKLFNEGDVVLTSRGTVGQTKILSEDASVNQSCYCLKPDNRINSYHLHYAMQSKRDKLESIAVGGTFDSITKRELAVFDIPVPPLWEQERIASILYTVDEMIARTSDLIDEYERLKRGLMQDLLSGDVRTPEDLSVLDEIKLDADSAGADGSSVTQSTLDV